MNDSHRQKKRGARIAAYVVIAFYIIWIIVALSLYAYEHFPILFLIYLLAVPTVIIIGLLTALRLRLKEIDGGEEDEARKY